MNEIVWRIGFALLFGLIFAFSARRSPIQPRRRNNGLSTLLFPFTAVALLLMPVLFSPWSFRHPGQLTGTYLTIFHAITAIFFSILLYDGLLLLLLPWLRKRIKAVNCALLWLLPCAMPQLYSMLINLASPFKPLFFLRINGEFFMTLFWVWLGGFLLAMLWQLLSHMRFRRQILRDAIPADESALRVLWEVEGELCVEAERKLVYSRAAQSPLSIGVFNKSLRIVLPLRNSYSLEALRLILRHELIHISEGHNQLKFTMAFVTAFGWFLPTQWLGLRRAAEDLELSCDEQATKGLSQEELRQYAALILNNAGTAPGFTTCLSASARGLRYRLGRVLHPETRRNGALAVGIILTLFILGLGLVGFAPGGGKLGDAIRENRTKPIQVSTLDYGCPDGRVEFDFVKSVDSEGLLDAIEEIRLYRMPGYSHGSVPGGFGSYPYLQINLEGGGRIIIHRDAAHRQCYVYLSNTDSVYLTDRMIDLDALIQNAEP